MSAEDIRKRVIGRYEKAKLKRLAALQAAGDDSGIDYSDIPPMTQEQLDSMIPLRDARRKIGVSVRVEPRVVEWLKSKGPGYLSRINGILVEAMLAEQKAAARK